MTEAPLPHLTGKKIERVNPGLQCARGVVIAIIGIGMGVWELLNLKHKTSTSLTMGVGFVGFFLLLFGLYEADRWKNLVVEARKRKRKENAA